MTILFKLRAPAVVAALAWSTSVGLLCSAGCSSKVLGDQPQNLSAVADGGAPFCTTAADGGFATMGGGFAGASGSLGPVVGTIVNAADPPPPLSGGTLLVLGDGHTAVASDPDRDQVWIADLGTGTLTTSVALMAHDEPGRLVEDAAGRVHIALRRGGAVVTLDPQAGTVLWRRPVCAVPRGIEYDPSRDLVYVACLGGELISLPAAGGDAVRTLSLPGDLRDVVLDGNNLMVSRFRGADVLVVDADSGQLSNTVTLPTFFNVSVRGGAEFTASTAWRMRPAPGGGALMLHQRGVTGPVVAGPGGYGSPVPGGCDAIVQAAMTAIKVGQSSAESSPMAGMVLAIDFALSSDGSKTAVIAAGNSQNSQLARLFVARTIDLTADIATVNNCGPDGVHSPSPPGGAAGTGGTMTVFVPDGGAPDGGLTPPTQPPQPTGEVESVAFDGNDRVVIQTREPATLQIPQAGVTIALSSVSRFDTGHAIFHANSGAGIACASCHAEGQEDGRIWEFDCLGPRRTMGISGGISTRTPYHWNGDLPDFPSLMQEIYVGRMSGEALDQETVDATLHWINSIPRLPPVVSDTAAVARGQALFADPVGAGCIVCHNGPNMSTNAIVDVGTGGLFKVPALTGVVWQAPYMHDGCAPALTDRFTPGSVCNGGDKHGHTSNLTSAQISDLIAYLQSL